MIDHFILICHFILNAVGYFSFHLDYDYNDIVTMRLKNHFNILLKYILIFHFLI